MALQVRYNNNAKMVMSPRNTMVKRSSPKILLSSSNGRWILILFCVGVIITLNNYLNMKIVIPNNASIRSTSNTRNDDVGLPPSSSSPSSPSWIDLHTIHTGEELFRRALLVNNPTSTTTKGCTIDILSIGSRTLPLLQKAQYNSWASHSSRRFFIAANELDDPDPNCSVNVTSKYALEMSDKCRARTGKKFWKQAGNATNWLTDDWTEKYAGQQWLDTKSNPGGWMCAQRRFTASLSKLLRLYRDAIVAAKKANGGSSGRNFDPSQIFPDYLILGDDDTAIDLEYISNKLCHQPKEREREREREQEINKNKADAVDVLLEEPQPPSKSTVYAGCLIRLTPDENHKYAVPYGGFGVFFSKGSLERFAAPLECNSDDNDDPSTKIATTTTEPTQIDIEAARWRSFHPRFVKEACLRLSPSTEADFVHLGERTLFTPGMSVSDLMGVFTASDDHFCVHSDWAITYFVNFYSISRHTPEGDGIDFHTNFDARVNHGRMFSLDGSYTYAYNSLHDSTNYCINDSTDLCREHPTRAVCHRLGPDDMADIYNYSTRTTTTTTTTSSSSSRLHQ